MGRQATNATGRSGKEKASSVPCAEESADIRFQA